MRVTRKNGRIYRQAIYESEQQFEVMVGTQLSVMFSDFHVASFKPDVVGDEGGRRRPDLVLVDKSYRAWIVVEVELAHHSLEAHVYPQMSVLATGHWDDVHAVQLASACPMMDPHRISELVAYVPPKVVVVVNSRSVLGKGWNRLRTDLGVELMFLEEYQIDGEEPVLLMSGYEPEVRAERLAFAKKDRMLNALMCRPPRFIADRRVRLEYEGVLSEWEVIHTVDLTMLLPLARIVLEERRNYEIIVGLGGALLLRPCRTNARGVIA